MAVSLGDAVITIAADTSGFEKSLDSGVDDAMAGVEKKTSDTGKKSGSKMGAFLGGALKKTAVGVGAGAVATLGYSLTKGFQRLTSIDDAKAKLLGLGNSAQDVEKIMDNALKAVKGTSYGLGEAATTAAAAVAAGVKPGEQLTKYLTLVGDAASIAGVGMDEMGAIFNKVTTAGMAQTDDLNQIADRGIPIWTSLGEMYGKTAVEVRKMASEGQISAADFNKAMQSMVGGAAQEAGKTFKGAFANLKAAMGRVGANFLEPFFAAAVKGMGGLTDMLGPIEAFATKAGTALKGLSDLVVSGDFSGNLTEAFGWTEDSVIVDKILDLRDIIQASFAAIRDSFGNLRTTLGGIDWVTVAKNFGVIATGFGAMALGALKLTPLVVDLVAAIVKLIQPLLESRVAVITLTAAILGGITAYKAYKAVTTMITAATTAYKDVLAGATIAQNSNTAAAKAGAVAAKANVLWTKLSTSTLGTFIGVKALELAAWVRDTAAMVAYRTTMIAVTVATKITTIATTALGVAMKVAMGPVGWIIAALGLLVAGLVLAYKKSETFRNIVNKAFAKVREVAGAVVDWFKDDFVGFFTETLPNAFRAVLDWVKSNWPKIVALLTGPIGTAILILTGHGDQIKEMFTGIADGVRNALDKIGDIFTGLFDLVVKGDFTSKLHDAFGWFEDSSIVGAILGFRDVVVGAFGNIKDAAVNLFTGDLSGAASSFKSFFTDAIAGINETIKGFVPDLIERGKELIGGLIDGAKAKGPELAAWIMGLPGRIKEWAAGLADALTGRGGGLVQGIIDGAKNKVTALIDWIKGLPARVKEKVTGWAEYLRTNGGQLIQGIIDGAKAKALELAEWFKGLPQRIKEWIPNAGAWLKEHGSAIIKGLIKGLKIAIPVLLGVVLGLPLLIVGAILGSVGLLVYAGATLIWELAKGIGKAIKNKLQPVFTKLTTWISTKFANAWSKLTGIILAPITAAREKVSKAWEVIQSRFTKAKNWVSGGWRNSWSNVSEWMSGAVQKGRTRIGNIWDGIRERFTNAKDWTRTSWRNSWSNVADWISNGVQNGREKTSKAWDGIKNRFNTAKEWTRTTWKNGWSNVSTWMAGAVQKGREKIGGALGQVRDRFNGLRTWMGGDWRARWNKVAEIIRHPIESAKKAIRRLMSNESFRTIFEAAVNAIDTVWSKIKSIMAKPVNWVINNVFGTLVKGINAIIGLVGGTKLAEPKPIKGYATGGIADTSGIVPGYTPGRDIGIAAVSGGEPIMRPEFGRAVGENWVHAANAAARRGGVAGAKRFLADQQYGRYMGGFRTGGLVGGSGRFSPLATQTLLKAQQLAGSQFSIFQRGFRPATSYSGTSHQGDAIDTGPVTNKIVAALRAAGWAAWDRTGKGQWVPHIHGVPLPGAGYAAGSGVWQAQDYLRGGDGLGGSDNGPRNMLSKVKAWLKGGAKGIAEGVGNFADAIGLDPTSLLTNVTDAMKKAKELTQTPFGRIIAKLPKILAEKAVEWGKKKLSALGLFGGDEGGGAGATTASWTGKGVGSWSKPQLDNAATIVSVARSLGLGDKGAMIGLITAMQESMLRNINYGDRDSIGLFQQRTPWGSSSARLNPAVAAKMFFTGGAGGQPGLMDKNWQSMGLAQAAQAVQVSAFPGAYSQWIDEAQAILQTLSHNNARSYDNGGWLPQGYSVAYNGTGRGENKAVFTQDQWQILHDLASSRTSSGTHIKPGDRVVFEIEGRPVTAIAKKVMADETRRALVRN